MNIDTIEALRKYIQANKLAELSASGNSMFPTINKNDKIFVEDIDKPISIGDIILFYDGKDNEISLVAHRVIKAIDDKFFITKGDNNTSADYPVRKKNILGKVIRIEPIKGDNK